jgi:hypothetical protein
MKMETTLGVAWLQQLFKKAGDADKVEAAKLLADLDEKVARYNNQRTAILAELRKVSALLRAKAGLPQKKSSRGPAPAKFKIVSHATNTPDQFRTGWNELAVFFSNTWATVASKGLAILKDRYPDEPAKWHLTIETYEVHLLP